MRTLTVRHVTVYRYAEPVRLGEHRMMFRPRDSHDQRLIEARLVIEPEPVALRWIHDSSATASRWPVSKGETICCASTA